MLCWILGKLRTKGVGSIRYSCLILTLLNGNQCPSENKLEVMMNVAKKDSCRSWQRMSSDTLLSREKKECRIRLRKHPSWEDPQDIKI
jgi:hypothetical protein